MKYFFTLLLAIVFIACSSEIKQTTVIIGSISVADSLDQSSNFAGIGYLVFRRDSTQKADTLFYAETDSLGSFKGSVTVPNKGIYPVYVMRNKKILASSSLILSSDDTVKIKAQLPAYNGTEQIESPEYLAADILRRVNKNFSRLANYVNAGKVSQDTLPTLLGYWSNLYWSVHKKYPKTIAGDESVRESFRLLAGVNDSLLISKYDSLQQFPTLRIAFARVAADAVARVEGLESALTFLKKRQQEAPTDPQKLQIIRNEIELLADSNQYSRSYETIIQHEKLFKTVKNAQSWATYFKKEVGRLRPGNELPEFSLAIKKDSISKSTFTGKFYVLEVAGLTSQAYLDEFPELNAVSSLYKNMGLVWITVPLDQQVTIDAFVNERKPNWTFTGEHNFDTYRLMDSLNVISVPTRFFIDKEGKIIRKYGPNQFNRLINDILTTLQSDKKENS